MSNTFNTPNMNLAIPVVGQEQGPDYAQDVNTAFQTVDSHDHSTSKGVQITPAGLNINADLSLQSNNLNVVRALRCLNNATTLSGVGDINCAYVDGGDLYYNNANGVAVQITAGSGLNSAALVNNAFNLLSVTSDHVINSADVNVVLDITTNAARSITLPRANAVSTGRLYFLKDASGSAASNNITIHTVSGDLLDGASTAVINTNYSALILISDGSSNWLVLSMIKGVAGDLSGSLPSPTVVAIQGHSVSSQSLGSSQDGYYLMWDNTDGYFKSNPVTSINNIKVTSQSLGSSQDGYALQWDNTDGYLKYQQVSLTKGVIGSLPVANQTSQVMGGDVSGTTASATVTGLQGNAVKSGALGSTQDGYVLAWKNSSSQWQPSASSSALTIAGDVTGTLVNSTVAKINGVSVQASPSSNYVLIASSSSASSWGLLVNAQISSSAAIAYSKLNLTGDIINADINSSAAIAYSKLNLTGDIVNADVSTSAAIAGSKLSPVFVSGQTVAIQSGATLDAYSGSTTILAGTTNYNGVLHNINGTMTVTADGYLTVLGAIQYQITNVSSSTYVVDSNGYPDYYILCNPASNTIGITLPRPSICVGRLIWIKDTGHAATHTIQINPYASETIDGAGDLQLTQNYTGYGLITNGTNWFTVGTAT